MRKSLIILGSTGSIGKSILNVIRKNKANHKVELLTTNNNINRILNQATEFKVKNVIIFNKKKFIKYKLLFKIKKINVFFNIEDFLKKFKKKVFYTINAISGISGLEPSLKIIKYSENIAIANKESIICGWKFICKELKKNKTNFIPIDSEHFSIWSLLKSEKLNNINKIYITASGGPFLKKKLSQLKNIKSKDALNHPNWSMGKKISIDSATMMNKVFEIIEAKKIFNIDLNKLNIIIHPKSYVHAIICFNNGLYKILAHDTNMEIPIANSLDVKNEHFNYRKSKIDFNKLNHLNFSYPDIKKFPVLSILKIVPIKESYFETILITLNDELVMNYLNGNINYFSIHKVLLRLLKKPYFVKYYYDNPKNINDLKNMVMIVKNYLNKYLSKYENIKKY